jgi:hypothetical protein
MTAAAAAAAAGPGTYVLTSGPCVPTVCIDVHRQPHIDQAPHSMTTDDRSPKPNPPETVVHGGRSCIEGGGKRARLARALGKGLGGARQWLSRRVAAPTARIRQAAGAEVLGKKKMGRALGAWAVAALVFGCLQAAAPGVARAIALPAPSADGAVPSSPLSPWQRGLILGYVGNETDRICWLAG